MSDAAMLLIVGTIRLPPDRLAQALPHMAQMVAASRAEPGCIDYAYAADVLDPGLIRVTEVWRDRAAFDAHVRSPHLASWRASWPALGITDRQLRGYSAGRGDPV